jgi:hypothetical protein
LKAEKKIIALDFDLGKHKQAFVEKLLSLIHQGKLTECIFILKRGWLNRTAKQKSIRFCETMKLCSSHPERTEVLMVQYCNPVEEIHFISEVEHGIKPVLGEWQRLDLSI